MNLIQYASKKERVHVEQIIREQPVLKDADNVAIKTISVRKSLGLTMDVFAPAAASDECRCGEDRICSDQGRTRTGRRGSPGEE